MLLVLVVSFDGVGSDGEAIVGFGNKVFVALCLITDISSHRLHDYWHGKSVNANLLDVYLYK